MIAHLDDVKKLDFSHDIYLYSQTTKSLDEFHRIISYIQEHISPDAHFQSFDTICRQVANRMPNISKFAAVTISSFSFADARAAMVGCFLKNVNGSIPIAT